MATTLNITDLATELGTDARSTRKFLRSITPIEEQPGKGGRWELPKAKVRSIKSQYAKFVAEAEAKRAEAKANDEVSDDTVEVEDTES